MAVLMFGGGALLLEHAGCTNGTTPDCDGGGPDGDCTMSLVDAWWEDGASTTGATTDGGATDSGTQKADAAADAAADSPAKGTNDGSTDATSGNSVDAAPDANTASDATATG